MIKIINNSHEWDIAVSKFKNLDVYYDHNFAKSFAEFEHGELNAAFYENSEGKIFYPFIKNQVYLPELDYTFNDIVTPYGYGGIYLEGDQTIIKDFKEDFNVYCKKNNIITETIRFHPLINNHIFYSEYDKRYIRKTTSVDLSPDLSVIRQNYKNMTRRNIKKAHKNGIKVYEADININNIKAFKSIYDETMDRNNASNYYYFDVNFFSKQLMNTELVEPKLIFATFNGEIIAGLILLLGDRFAHYHLGASNTSYLHLRPNNILFDYMIEIAKRESKEFLHLGGGYSEGDGLFKYKSSFTNNNHHNYYLGTIIHNSEIYNEIYNFYTKNFELNLDFFPIYRVIK